MAIHRVGPRVLGLPTIRFQEARAQGGVVRIFNTALLAHDKGVLPNATAASLALTLAGAISAHLRGQKGAGVEHLRRMEAHLTGLGSGLPKLDPHEHEGHLSWKDEEGTLHVHISRRVTNDLPFLAFRMKDGFVAARLTNDGVEVGEGRFTDGLWDPKWRHSLGPTIMQDPNHYLTAPLAELDLQSG
jgi:hypothetical protein